jgi:hypothetical protein
MARTLWVLLAALSTCLSLTLTAGAAATENRARAAGLEDRASPADFPLKELGALTDQATAYATAASANTTSPTAASASTTSASIAPSLSPDRRHAKATLTVAIDYAGGESGLPSPVRSAILGLPAGLSLNIPVLRSCDAEVLLAHGVSGCPAHSLIGTGHATALFNLGSQQVLEHVQLWAFLGPLRNLQPTFEILGEGFKPLGRAVVLTATALPARAPYGEELAMSIPPLATVPGQPDASITSFSLTIGISARKRTSASATIVVPTHCPRGGLPFTAAFTYANGAQNRALAKIPCPV